jgi:L-threonylcarbamoyladenylate synthase
MNMPLQTQIVELKPGPMDPMNVRQITEIIQRDGVMAYPTDTFYGLGASAYSERALQKVYRLKKRDRGKPLSVVISGIEMAEKISVSLPPIFEELSREYWPGPLTLIIKAKPLFPPRILGPAGSLALRLPDVPWLLELVRQMNTPLTATSANISGAKEIADPGEVIRIFRWKVDLIVDGGPTPGGLPSTIVDLTSEKPRILREGAIPESRLRRYL